MNIYLILGIVLLVSIMIVHRLHLLSSAKTKKVTLSEIIPTQIVEEVKEATVEKEDLGYYFKDKKLVICLLTLSSSPTGQEHLKDLITIVDSKTIYFLDEFMHENIYEIEITMDEFKSVNIYFKYHHGRVR